MAIEIERKFLVADASVLDGRTGRTIAQGYLPVEDPTSVRVRLQRRPTGAEAFLTIKKGRSALARLEYEYPVPVEDAEAMLETLCGGARVRKTRYEIEYAGRIWEVDRFDAENAPLVLAEIELEAEDAVFERPPWLGPEVTEDTRMTNVQLCRRPIQAWDETERIELFERETPC
jgi:adenylate cyclase